MTYTLYVDPVWDGTYEVGIYYTLPWRSGYTVSSSTGVVTENASATSVTSDYMSVYGITKMATDNASRHFHVFYDADKNYLSSVTIQSNSTPMEYDVPEGAVYMIVTGLDAYSNWGVWVIE